MKILFVGDSLGLPRPDGSIKDDETWCHIVARELKQEFDFYYFLRGGLHTRELLIQRLHVYLGGYDPDVVVLQIGIVDCSPRVLGLRGRKIVSSLPVIRHLIIRLINKFHTQFLRLRSTTFVTKEEFRSNLQRLKASFEKSKVVCIPIAPANKAYEEHIVGISQNIVAYNKVARDVFGSDFCEDFYDCVDIEELFLFDNHHLSLKGHRALSIKVVGMLNDLALENVKQTIVE